MSWKKTCERAKAIIATWPKWKQDAGETITTIPIVATRDYQLPLASLLRQPGVERRPTLVMSKGATVGDFEINGVPLYIRDHTEAGLKTVAVDTVVFFGETPDAVRQLALERLRTSRAPRTIDVP